MPTIEDKPDHNVSDLMACQGHAWEPLSAIHYKRCMYCKGYVSNEAAALYAQGLKHGRAERAEKED